MQEVPLGWWSPSTPTSKFAVEPFYPMGSQIAEGSKGSQADQVKLLKGEQAAASNHTPGKRRMGS
jgi:hypothetical protein